MKKLFKIYSFLILFFLPSLISAESEWKTHVDWPDSPGGIELSHEATIAELVAYFYEWAIALGMLFALGILIYSSVQYIISAGSIKKIKAAQERIGSAFMGILLLAASWLLLTLLNPELTVISDTGISTLQNFEESEFTTIRHEDEVCDYGVVAYGIGGDDEVVILEEGEARIFGRRREGRDPAWGYTVDPFFSIACKARSGFGDHDTDQGVRFIRANEASSWQELEPVCNDPCAEDPDQECPDEFFAEVEEGDDKFCYDYRYLGSSFPGSVKYISQRPGGISLTCLAGDERIMDGGNCSLNLYETSFAARCGFKITQTPMTGTDVQQNYDEPIRCLEVMRGSNPFPDEYLY